MSRAIILVLDSLGIGGALDADKFGDKGSNTFLSLVRHRLCQGKRLDIPNLTQLGLVEAARLSVCDGCYDKQPVKPLIGSFGACNERSFGKDTPSGHWEIAGAPALFDFGFFEADTETFPQELTDRILERAQLKGFLGNCHASGTDILIALGEEHIKTGFPIFYTSADSVFQIACHEEHFGLDRLYELCLIAREELADYNIGRVIARPFVGEKAKEFMRTGNRKDYALKPPMPTVLEKLIEEKNGEVYSIGKIADIYAHQGISHEIKATGPDELFKKTLSVMDEAGPNSIIFTNFVDFDSSYGHRRDVEGYATALEYFDKELTQVFKKMDAEDILYITADHGCDPAWQGTDHTRERVPILLYGHSISVDSLGIRDTFSDIGQTLAKQFHLSPMDYGISLV